MNKYDVERAIIANRPGEPFVLVERLPGVDEIADLSTLDWQASTAPPTWRQARAWAAALALEDAREAKCAEILAALSKTDLWARRHVEDGASLTPERIAYCVELRRLRDAVLTSDDPASLTLPDDPPFQPVAPS